jgi:hypothetical protein
MKFQIEEDLSPLVVDETDHLWSSMEKELFSDFEEADLIDKQGDVFLHLI